MCSTLPFDGPTGFGIKVSRAIAVSVPACWMIWPNAPVTPSAPLSTVNGADVLEGRGGGLNDRRQILGDLLGRGPPPGSG